MDEVEAKYEYIYFQVLLSISVRHYSELDFSLIFSVILLSKIISSLQMCMEGSEFMECSRWADITLDVSFMKFDLIS